MYMISNNSEINGENLETSEKINLKGTSTP